MKYLLASAALLAATPSFAHPGHVAELAGHTHEAGDFVLVALALAIMAAIGIYAISRRK